MKKYYEFQLIGFESIPDSEGLQKFRELQLPGKWYGYLAGKFMVWAFGRLVKAGKKNWDKKILEDPTKLSELPVFPKIHLMKVYEEPNHIMREKK